MSTMTPRDKWLAAALPAMITLLVGWFFFLRPAGREVDSLRRRVTNQGSLDARKLLVAGARSDRAGLERELAEMRAAPAGGEAIFDRNLAIQQVSLLCAANNLSLNRSEPDRAAQLPPALRDAIPAFAAGGTPPQVWRVELSGTYPNVVRLLGGLQETDPLIVPLNLDMQTGKNESQPSDWVLTLWL